MTRSGRSWSALLREAGISDYSIHLDEETNTLFGVLWRTRRSRDGRAAEPSGDAALVGAYGRHHGDEAGQRAGRGAARNRLPHAMTMERPGHVAVIDIGKTNAKVALVEMEGSRRSPCARCPTRCCTAAPYPHFDVDGLWDFILDALARAQPRARRSMRSR